MVEKVGLFTEPVDLDSSVEVSDKEISEDEEVDDHSFYGSRGSIGIGYRQGGGGLKSSLSENKKSK